jgi:hypothetical protein
MINSVIIRAFRATDDYNACQRFIESHRKVLEYHGIKQVTSLNNEWVERKSVFVILVETIDRQKILGGARIHVADGTHPLPLEKAIGEMDSRIYGVVKEKSKEGTSELCGLWNSREVAGMGIGAFFAIKAGVVIAKQIGLKSIFALCSPYTVRFAERVGCTIIKSLGINGTFYYPKLDLIATIVLLENTETLKKAEPNERESIFKIRQNPSQVVRETSPIRKSIQFDIHYELQINEIKTDKYKK